MIQDWEGGLYSLKRDLEPLESSDIEKYGFEVVIRVRRSKGWSTDYKDSVCYVPEEAKARILEMLKLEMRLKIREYEKEVAKIYEEKAQSYMNQAERLKNGK